MKALEKLREYANIDFGCDMSTHQEECLEAITELEALQQRSCEECVHRSFIGEVLINKVTNGFCMKNGFFTKRDFCCNRYEAKPLS